MRAKFHSIKYINTQGAVIDISDLVSELSVYQSVFDHYMQVEIVMQDSIDISHATRQDAGRNINGGFSGGEILLIQYTARDNPTLSNSFILYERANRSKVSDTMETYILSGISLEAFESYPRKISRAFGYPNGNTIDKMIKSLFDEYVYSRGVKDQYGAIKSILNTLQEKKLKADPTAGLQKFVIPNLSLDDTIKFLCNEADSDSFTARYMFWERQDGFYFRNLENLVQREPVAQYFYTEFNIDQYSNDQNKIINYKIKKETNFLENARDGMYKSKTIHLDPLKKTTNETIFDYDEIREFNSFHKLQQFYHSGSVSDENVNVTLMTTRKGHDISGQVFESENHLPKRIDSLVATRKSYTKHLFNTVLSITVPGTTLINAGDTINIEFPLKSLLENSPGGNDPQLSGKYLVTKLRNKFTQSVGNVAPFVTVMECVKDTQTMEDFVLYTEEA